MTPDPDARCVVTRSAVRGTTPSLGAYEVAKISTIEAVTVRVVASSTLLRSPAAATRGGDDAAGACAASPAPRPRHSARAPMGISSGDRPAMNASTLAHAAVRRVARGDQWTDRRPVSGTAPGR